MNKSIKASLWLSRFQKPSARFSDYLKSIYGNDEKLIERKIEKYIKVLSSFVEKYGDREVIIARAPGRINLMGRHVEHRGGNINTIAIHKETIMIAATRPDDVVNISNTDGRFTDASFSVSKEMQVADFGDWIEYIYNPDVKKRVAEKRDIG